MELQGMSVGEDDVRKTWNEYFEDLHNVGTGEQVTIIPVLKVLEGVIILVENGMKGLSVREGKS